MCFFFILCRIHFRFLFNGFRLFLAFHRNTLCQFSWVTTNSQTGKRTAQNFRLAVKYFVCFSFSRRFLWHKEFHAQNQFNCWTKAITTIKTHTLSTITNASMRPRCSREQMFGIKRSLSEHVDVSWLRWRD